MNGKRQPLTAAKRRQILTENLWGYAFIGGSVALLVLLLFYPLGYSFVMTFQKWNPIMGGRFIGWENYQSILTDSLFFKALLNNAEYAVWTILGGFVLSFGAAVLVKSLPSQRFRNGLRFFYFIPSICNTIMISMMWGYLMQDHNGFLNACLAVLGLSGPGWLSNPTWAKISLYWIVIWSNLGYWMVVFMTKLMDIPETYYEAARIDGADFFTSFRHITLPLSTPVIYLYLSMALITCWGQFDIAQTLATTAAGANGALGYMGPNNALLLPTYSIYNSAFGDMNFGFAAVKGWILILIIVVLTVANNSLSKLWVHYDE